MLAMQFNGFTWPNNPSDCRLELKRDVAVHKYPGGGYSLEEMGASRRVFSGQGEFYGENAYTDIINLIQVYETGGAGLLVHPVVELQQALFTELTLIEEPRANYVAYSFAFEEDGVTAAQPMTSAGEKVCMVLEGNTLWDIAEQYGVQVEILLALNPWIINPNRLTAGKRVVLP